MPVIDPRERLLHERDAADFLGVSIYRLQRWRCYGGGPNWVKIGGREGRAVRYRRSDLEAYIDANTMNGGRPGR